MDNGYKQLRRKSCNIWKVAYPRENWKYWCHFIGTKETNGRQTCLTLVVHMESVSCLH